MFASRLCVWMYTRDVTDKRACLHHKLLINVLGHCATHAWTISVGRTPPPPRRVHPQKQAVLARGRYLLALVATCRSMARAFSLPASGARAQTQSIVSQPRGVLMWLLAPGKSLRPQDVCLGAR